MADRAGCRVFIKQKRRQRDALGGCKAWPSLTYLDKTHRSQQQMQVCCQPASCKTPDH